MIWAGDMVPAIPFERYSNARVTHSFVVDKGQTIVRNNDVNCVRQFRHGRFEKEILFQIMLARALVP
jgi:hypothetical protein